MSSFTLRVFLDDDDEYTVGLRFGEPGALSSIDLTPAQARHAAENMMALADKADAKQLDAERATAQAIAAARRPAERPSWFEASFVTPNFWRLV